MDASKLLNILYDLESEENDYKPGNALTNIVTNYGQLRTQNNPAQSKALKDNLKALESLSNESIFNGYAPSDDKILLEIGGMDYIGTMVHFTVSEIVNNESFINEESYIQLVNYQKDRKKFIETALTLKSNLDELNVDPHYSHTDYEFGVLIPDNEELKTFAEVEKRLHRWNIILGHLNEVTGEDAEEAKISFVNNGCLEFFSNNPEATVMSIVVILERLAALYKRVLEIRELRIKMQDYKFPKDEVASAAKHERSSLDSGMDEIVEEVFKQYAKKLETGRKNELKVALKKHVQYISKEIDNGTKFEVRPPELLDEPTLKDDASENEKKDFEKKKKEFELKTQKIEFIKKAIETTKEIITGAKEVFKLIKPEETEIEEGKDK